MNDEESGDTPADDEPTEHLAYDGDEPDDSSAGGPRLRVDDLWAQIELPKFEIPEHLLRGFQLDTSHLQSLMTDVAQQIAGQLDTSAFRYEIAPEVLRAISGTVRTDEFMKGWSEIAGRLVEPFRDLAKIPMPSVPANWPRDRMPSLSRLVELAFEYGIPIIWVPSEDVIVDLAGAEEPDVALVEAASTVLSDCRIVAQQCEHPALATAVSMLGEAIDVAEDGKWLAAQAAATIVCEYLWVGSHADLVVLSDVYPPVPDNPMKITMRMLRPMFVVNSAEQAWKQFWVKRGDEVPKQFNRHASTHTLDEAQYTTRNALVAVLLAASLMREVQELVDPPARTEDAA
jgi:hypothetical protein